MLGARSRGADRLAALDAGAVRQGLVAGMALAEARAMLPELVSRPHDVLADARTLADVAECSIRYTPIAGLDPPAGLFLDLTGAAHLQGGEQRLRDDLLARLARQGFEAAAAIAPTAGAAWALVRTRGGGIVAPGASQPELDRLLSPLPIRGLRLTSELLGSLARLGLATIGALMTRPREPITARFGPTVLARLDEARGLRSEPIDPHCPIPPVVAEESLAEPIMTADAVAVAVAHLAGRLCAELAQREEGATAVRLSLFRLDNQSRHIDVALAAPSCTARDIAGLIGLRLGTLDDPLDPGFGYDVVRLCALNCAPLGSRPCSFPALASTHTGSSAGATGADSDWGFADAVEEPAKRTALIDRLIARFGSERVLSVETVDTHIPERAATFVPLLTTVPPPARPSLKSALNSPVRRVVPPASSVAFASGFHPSSRPLRLIEPPQAVDVVAEVPDGPPLLLRWRRRPFRVAFAEGPERIAPEWWRERRWAHAADHAPRYKEQPEMERDYWRIEDANGTRLWVFRAGNYGEPSSPRWFVHGLFA